MKFIEGKEYKLTTNNKENYPFVKNDIFVCKEVDEEGGCWAEKTVKDSDITMHFMGDNEELEEGSIVEVKK